MNKPSAILPITLFFFVLYGYPTDDSKIYETPTTQALQDAKSRFKIFKISHLTKYIHSKGSIKKSKNPKWCRELYNFKKIKKHCAPHKRKNIVKKRHKKIRKRWKNK